MEQIKEQIKLLLEKETLSKEEQKLLNQLQQDLAKLVAIEQIEQLPATGAGINSGTNGEENEGHIPVSIDYENPTMTPDSGFDTNWYFVQKFEQSHEPLILNPKDVIIDHNNILNDVATNEPQRFNNNYVHNTPSIPDVDGGKNPNITDIKHDNNGFGNGDQNAPGNSLEHNGAENDQTPYTNNNSNNNYTNNSNSIGNNSDTNGNESNGLTNDKILDNNFGNDIGNNSGGSTNNGNSGGQNENNDGHSTSGNTSNNSNNNDNESANNSNEHGKSQIQKGNEGLGNGQDAPPPGHDTNQNDYVGTSPGNPGIHNYHDTMQNLAPLD